jgi:hypothetical protein
MRAVRFCLTDLERYIADPEVRRRHRRKQMTQDAVPFKQPKLVWVKEQLSALEPVAKKCRDIENQHSSELSTHCDSHRQIAKS